jgi:hypothetical protein
MTIKTKMLAGAAGFAALAAAAPASAQWGYSPYATNPYVASPYVANPYAYQQQYATPYAYQQQYASPYAYQNQYAVNASTQVAAQRCSAAVQQRLHSRQGLTGVVASMLGVPTVQPRVVSITNVTPRQNSVRVRGLAASGRSSGYSPYAAMGALGYAYQPDISFACTVDYRGYVRDVDINRR